MTTWIGTGISGTFLFLIGALNADDSDGHRKAFPQVRHSRYHEAELDRELASGGLMGRFFGRFSHAVSEPWHMYPVGMLFGLGFGTATEVALLFLAVGAAGAGLPFYAILCLPVLLAAGMSLLDMIDGSVMDLAYGRALSMPIRKLFYNATVTGLSIVTAWVIGTIELAGLLAHKLDPKGAVRGWLENINLNMVGFLIAGLFVVTWAVALAIWRFARIEDRWSASIAGRKPASG